MTTTMIDDDDGDGDGDDGVVVVMVEMVFYVIRLIICVLKLHAWLYAFHCQSVSELSRSVRFLLA